MHCIMKWTHMRTMTVTTKLPNSATLVPVPKPISIRCSLEMCVGQNLQERERKETRSRLKKIFLVPIFFRFFSFLERVFPLFPIFLGISHPVLRRSFPVFSSFDLSKPVPGFLMDLKLAILERVLNENLCKPVPRRSSNRSSPFLKSFLVFPQPVFLSNKEKREPRTASVLKGYTLASV